MYASSTKLYRIASDKKYSTANSFSLYKFKAEQALELRPVAQTVSINFGNVNYNVEYKYDSANNQYNREQAGKPHIDAETNTQLTTKNVVVMIVKRSSTVTAIDEQGWTMQTIGSGEASVFQDGVEIKATWKKDNENARTHFFNKTTGIEIEFNAGPSWIEVISPDLTYGTK